MVVVEQVTKKYLNKNMTCIIKYIWHRYDISTNIQRDFNLSTIKKTHSMLGNVITFTPIKSNINLFISPKISLSCSQTIK